MKPTTVPAEVFGYLVCLLATVIFFMSVAGVVNNGFRVVHPTMQTSMMGGRHMRDRDKAPWMGRQGWQSQGSSIAPAPPMGSPGSRFSTMRDRFVADARYNALRGLVLAFVMLVLSIVVFRRTFGWLNQRQAVA
ncbi:MAG: hypothetical protein WAK16_08720 [Candidatus Cybelea sp.]